MPEDYEYRDGAVVHDGGMAFGCAVYQQGERLSRYRLREEIAFTPINARF
jgi:hypothetical protein